MQTQYLLEQYINGANTANSRGEFTNAATWCKQAIQLAPHVPEAWFNLGIAYRGLGKRNEALEAFEQTRVLTLNSADAQNSIGLQLIELGAYPEAESCLSRALGLAPNQVFALSNMGMLRQKQKQYQEAERHFRKAIALQPQLGILHVNLGATLNTLRKHKEAELVSREAIQRAPHISEAWNNLGSALFGQQRYEEAIQAAQEAIKLNEHTPEAWRTLGCSMFSLKRHEEAVASLSRSHEMQPDADFLSGMLLHAKMCICDWSSFERDLSSLAAKIQNGKKASPPFALLGLSSDLALQKQAAETWARIEAPSEGLPPLIHRPHGKEKIRIAYFSADFHNHATTYLMAELFELHDRKKFEFIAFSFGPQKKDEMRQRIENAFDTFLEVQDLSDKAIAQRSRELQVDIAIDLKGYTADCRPGIFFYRAAPIQVAYLGYPGTMGVSYIDYVIADKIVIPEKHQAHYTEKIAYLPDCYQVNDSTRKIADTVFSRAELGIPESAFVYCCFNSSFKITPATFDTWMNILKRTPDSVLWLLEDNATATRNLCREAQNRGVSPNRLIFAKRIPLAAHLARQKHADLFLDTLPCNAHTTASDALWAGLPVLTCTGDAFASRVAASLLFALNGTHLVTDTIDDYENLAVEFATNPSALEKTRRELNKNKENSPLFNSRLFTKNLEALYEEMFGRYCAKMPPENIDHAPQQ